jgi:barbiturase
MAYVVKKIPFESVTDTSGLLAAIKNGEFEGRSIVAIVGKTEGNGGVNDFSRILADRVLRDFLVDHCDRTHAEALEVPVVWSGGCDGVIAPHMTVFAEVPDDRDKDELRLTVGIAMSEEILPEEIGRMAMVDKVSDGVRIAMQRAGIDDPADVHYVQTKTPLLTAERIADAKARNRDVVSEDTLETMSISNATAALGIGVALGEVVDLRDDQIAKDLDVYSSVASCSSGVELPRAQIILVGNRRGIGGRFRVGHDVMNDMLDVDGIYRAIRSAGMPLPDRPCAADLGDAVVNCFIKCETDPSGRLRGRRLVSLNDSDIDHTHHTKAAVGAVAALATGDPATFCSVAALQSGPAGGGMVAAIVDMSKVSDQ